MEDEPFLVSSIGDDRDSIWFGPKHASSEGIQPDLMVYFIPGNPCLMSYYEPFLSHLSKLLNSDSKKCGQALVGGSTLPGFQCSQPTIIKGTLPASLKDQILNVEELIARSVAGCGSTQELDSASRDTKVILIAHSVGAYMTLEILRRKARHLNQLAGLDIIGAVLLFPTVTEIAQSRHGTILSTFLYVPYFPAIVALISRILTFLISASTLAWTISYLGGVPTHVGKASADLLKSPMGVYQALFLTIDEMATIRHDTWDETIWGSSQPISEGRNQVSEGRNQVVPLRFYFGEQDVWVSSKARDELIATRAKRDFDARNTIKPVMIIDDENIPHGFIVDHSERMAEKASSMIEDLIDIDKDGNYTGH